MNIEAMSKREDLFTEEEIVEEILSNAVKEDRESYRCPGAQAYSIAYGSKKFVLFFQEDEGNFSSFIKNREGLERKEHETSLLYSAAKKLMERLAADQNKTYTYTLRTQNQNIKNWADTKGRKIFQWQTEDEIPDEVYGPLYVFGTQVRVANTEK